MSRTFEQMIEDVREYVLKGYSANQALRRAGVSLHTCKLYSIRQHPLYKERDRTLLNERVKEKYKERA